MGVPPAPDDGWQAVRASAQRRLGDHDNAAGGAVQVIAGPRAEEAGDAANGDGNHQQAREAVGQQPRGRAGRDYQTDHQKRADGLQRRHGRDRQQREEENFQAFRTQADGAGVVLIKKGHHQIFPFEQQDNYRHHADNRQLDDIFGGDSQNIAEDDGLNVHRGRVERDHKQPQPEKRGEDQPDNGVLLQAAALVEKQHAARRQPAR